MEIKILGHRSAAVFLSENPGEHDVIMISGPDNFFGIEKSDTIIKNAKSYKLLAFDDVPVVRKGMQEPQRKHIEEALEFAKGKERLIVCCQAGISRSSAISYVLKTAEVGEFNALEVLDPKVHYPNPLIVKLGSEVLDRPDMPKLIRIWCEKAVVMQCEEENCLQID